MPELTPGFNIKKPLGNENVTRSAYNENLDIIDEALMYVENVALNASNSLNSHMHDYIRQPGYATTGGSANTYTLSLSPALAAYVAGVCVAVKIHAANTGASTLNIGGLGAKSIRDSKGNAMIAGKLRLDGVYTLRYDGTNFILQGDGGDGNAVSKDVLVGKTFSNDEGLYTGTLAFKLANSVKNGSFENGLNSWSGGSLTNTYAKVGDYSCKIQSPDGTNFSDFRQSVKIVGGHKYYACGFFMKSAAINGDGDFDIINIPVEPLTEMDIASLGNSEMPTINTWHLLSKIVTAPTSTDYATLRCFTFSTTPVFCDGLMLIDLDDTTNTGNAPSKEHMDAIVQEFGGWWESDLYDLTCDATALSGDVLQNKIAYAGGAKITGTLVPGADTADGTAYAQHILDPHTAYARGSKLTGTMPNRGTVTITPKAFSQSIAEGYHNGNGGVLGDPNLTPENIRYLSNIFDTNGTFTYEGSNPAGVSDILSGKVAFVNGVKCTGMMSNHGAPTWTPGSVNQNLAAGYYSGGTISGDSDLVEPNIKAGVNIFGKVGTCKPFNFGTVPKTSENTTSSSSADDYANYNVSGSGYLYGLYNASDNELQVHLSVDGVNIGLNSATGMFIQYLNPGNSVYFLYRFNSNFTLTSNLVNGLEVLYFLD